MVPHFSRATACPSVAQPESLKAPHLANHVEGLHLLFIGVGFACHSVTVVSRREKQGAKEATGSLSNGCEGWVVGS